MIHRFDNFELDVSRRRLLRDGELVALNPKAFDMLRVLVEHNRELLTKDDLLRLVWDGQFVEEANLTVNMSAIRRALGESARSPRYITTVSGRGYYFTGNVASSPDDFVVERHTLSRLVVEEEAEEDSSQDDRHLLPPARGTIAENPFVYMAAILVIAVAAGLVWYLSRPAARPFTRMTLTRLTTTGRVTMADLSPDGKLFAYSEQEPDGSIGIRLEHVDGSGQVELRSPGNVTVNSISFTPDASQIYYSITGDGHELSGLYRIPCFGGAPQYLNDFRGRIAFSPDGNQIAFVRGDTTSGRSVVFIADSVGTVHRELAHRGDRTPFVTSSIDWSADGKQIAVAAIVDETTRTQEIFLIDVESGAASQLTKNNWDGIRALGWLSERRGLIASAGDQDVGWEAQVWHVSTIDGTADKIVADLNAYGIVASPSKDGNSLLTVQAIYQSNIWVAPSDDLAQARQVTFDMFGRQNGWDGVAWLAGESLIFSSYLNRSETLWQKDLFENTPPKQIIPDGRRNIYVSTSRDGRLMAFESDRTGTSEVWVANSDGTNMRQLTNGGNNRTPHISPDGSSIIFASTRADSIGLWRVPVSGDAPVQLTKFAVNWAEHSPDGLLIAGSFSAEGKTKLGIFPAGGGDAIKAFDVPRQANFRLGVRWTPDGKSVTYRDWGYGIWRQRIDGGEPARLEGLPREKIYAYAWSKDGRQFAFSRGREIIDVVLITEAR